MITLRKHSINVAVDDRYGSIVYCYEFANRRSGKGSDELSFEFTIDPTAFISGFSADIDGVMFLGKTKEKKKAAVEYQGAVKAAENAILIDTPYAAKGIHNVFRIRTNIERESVITLKVTIEQFVAKQLHFNELKVQILRNFTNYNISPLIASIAVSVSVMDSRGVLEVSTGGVAVDEETMNELATKWSISGRVLCAESAANELTVRYKVKGEQMECAVLYDAATGTFCHIISDIVSGSKVTAISMESGGGGDDGNEGKVEVEGGDDIGVEAEGIGLSFEQQLGRSATPLIPRRVMFLIDKSGSMSGSKWEQTISAVTAALKQLRTGHDRFGVMLFNHEIVEVSPTMLLSNRANINKSVQTLRAHTAGGSTNINDALLGAIKRIRRDIESMKGFGAIFMDSLDCLMMNQIVLITDGEPNRGVTDTAAIIRNVSRANDLRDVDKFSDKVAIFCFGVGN